MILNYFLIIKYYALGAAIATVVSQFIVDMLQLLQVRKEMDLKEMFKPFVKYLIVGLFMYFISTVVAFICDTKIFVENNINVSEYVEYILTIAAQVVVGATVYIGILIISKDSLIMPVINRLKSRVVKK